jgi:hypothetical protein
MRWADGEILASEKKMVRLPSPAMCVAIASMLIALGGAGFSATGGNFLLGLSNTATTTTRLSTSMDRQALQVGNTSSGVNATALGLFVAGGRPPLYVNSAGKVDRLNADLLDGIEAAAFMQGGGVADGQAIAIAPSTVSFLGPATGGLVRLRYACPVSVSGNGTLRITNNSTSLMNLFVDSGGSNPDYYQLGSGGFVEYPASAGGDSFFIQAQGALGVQAVQVATVHRNSSNDCHAQALMMIAG